MGIIHHDMKGEWSGMIFANAATAACIDASSNIGF